MTFDLPADATQPPNDQRKGDEDNGDADKKKPILDSQDEPKRSDKTYNLLDNYRFVRGSSYVFPENYKFNNIILPSGNYNTNNDFVGQQSDPANVSVSINTDKTGPDSVGNKRISPDQNNASANNYSVVEDAETKTKRIVITGDNAQFQGTSTTNTDSYYFVKKGVTHIVRQGKNGGKTETFQICYNKVFAQTLFLGATVKSFNASMAWGSEASRLTVELAVDDCQYPEQRDFAGNIVPRPGFNKITQSAGVYDEQRLATDDRGFKKDELGNSLIPGKVFYMPLNGQVKSFYYYGPDPGFYADLDSYWDGIVPRLESVDIIGAAAQFRYDDFEFSGIITSWEKKTGSEGGILQYTVTLESPSKLLSNVGVILSDYSGSIHQSSRRNDPTNQSVYKGTNLGFPSEKGSSQEFYGGLIREQSIPNLVNVYGFLEDGGLGSSSNFGGSLRNSNGIPAYMVVSALTFLLDRPPSYIYHNGQQRQDAWQIFRYSPYGRIVSRIPTKKKDPYPSLVSNGQIDIRYKMGLAVFPGNNLVFKSGSSTALTPYSLDLNDFFFNGYSVLTAEYRIDSQSSNVLQILQDVADSHGYEMFVNMYMVADGNFLYPRIKINLITKQITPQEGAVQNFIGFMQSNNIFVTGNTVGEEYNADGNTRTMLIGGKQRRIFQSKFVKYALNQNTLRWNPYTQTFLDSTSPYHNTKDYRRVDLHNPRNSNLGYGNGAGSNNIIDILGRVDRNTPEYLYQTVPWGGLAYRMNYHYPESLGIIGPVPPAFDATAFGQICPYFGADPFTRMARHVEYNDYYGQFFVSINGLEFAKYTGFTVPGFVQISENEIRAAMKGYDSFVAYISGLSSTLYPYAHTHKFDLYNKILFPLVGNSPLVFNTGAVNANKIGQKVSGLDTVPVSATSSTLTDPRLVNVLNKIHLYLADIGNQYYGKEFMVGITRPDYYIDYNYHFGAVGLLPEGSPYSSLNGTKEVVTSYSPVESGWEEAGTTIDDSLMVGTPAMNIFQNDDGTISPILGYNATARYNRNRQFETLLTTFSNNAAKNAFLYNWNKFDLWRKSNYTGRGEASQLNFWEPSLTIAEPISLIIDYPSAVTDPFYDPTIGQRVLSPFCYKAYLKASVETDYVWAPSPTADGRALKIIVKTGGAYLNPADLHELSISATVADYVRPFWPKIPGLLNPISDRLDAMISGSPYYLYYGAGISTNNLLYANTQNKPNQNVSLVPKAAMPAFAAIPFESNVSVYGPWINSPDMYVDSIYPYSTPLGKVNKLENLLGGTKVLNESDLVPWNYGGMINLDMYAILKVSADNNYQEKGETGQITYAGIPFFNLGSELKAAAFAFRGPIINNIQTQISANGPVTTYTFRTYTKKFTLFNKEASELLKNQAKESFKRTKEIRQKFERVRNDLIAISKSKMIFPNYDLTLSKLRSASPSTILVGESRPYVSPVSTWNPGAIGNFPEKLNPDDPNENPIYWTINSSIQRTNVALYNIGEVAQEFEHNYSSKSFMSLDGLFSPVSFYPTLAGGSSSFKPYFETGCPNCGGTRRVVFNDNQGNATSLPCQLCSRDIAGTENATTYNILPPFILSNQSDSSILAGDNPTEIKDRISALLDNATMRKRINYVNLNPIIMPVGEFRNEYAQQNDYTSHHIEYVGRSQVPPRGDLSIQNNKNILGFDEDQSQLADADYNSRVFDWHIGRQETTSWTQKNYRFLGLRGPLVMSGWGFDTAGYPVPNASGEPLKVDPTNGMPFRMRAPYDPESEEPWSPDFRGPIVGKNQLWDYDKKEWSDPYPEPNFMRGWGLRPDLWPSGPVDLRWDAAKKVWSAPKPYPNVYVQLETDLVPPFPARGFLDAIDKDSQLPGGLRRTVFVRDSSETYGAPRGAKILCFYDEGSGFYEPLARSSIIARGFINIELNATLYADFAAGFNPVTGQPNAPEQIIVNFVNPLGFTLTTGAVGLFIFVRTEWVLMSINITC